MTAPLVEILASVATLRSPAHMTPWRRAETDGLGIGREGGIGDSDVVGA